MRMWLRVLAVVVLLMGVLGGCGRRAASQECVPNHPLACTIMGTVALGRYERPVTGVVEPCVAKCSDPRAAARGALESLAPGHPRLVGMDEFSPDLSVLCGGKLCTISGGHGTFVFYFEDGTTFAIDIRCGVGPNCRAM